MNKWIYVAVFSIALMIGIASGFLLSNAFVVKPLTHSYNKQLEGKDNLIVKLANMPRNLIENTLAVKKVKKGSNIYYIPSSDLKAVEIKMDSLVNDFRVIEDTTVVQNTTIWEKIKNWFN